MKVLVVSHHMGGLTGSETFWGTVIKYLKREGCEICVHAKVWGRYIGRLLEDGVGVLPLEKDLEGVKFDIVLTSQSTGLQVVERRLPKVPVIHFVMGVLPELERIPDVSVEWREIFCVSEEVPAWVLGQGFPAGVVTTGFNPVDPEVFAVRKAWREEVEKVCVVSNRMPEELEARVRGGIMAVGAEFVWCGERWVERAPVELSHWLRESDVVVGIGRCAIEGMMTGAQPLVMDYQGSDGLVTVENVEQLAACNFSGRAEGREWNAEDVARALARYSPSEARVLAHWARRWRGADRLVPALYEVMKESV